jgi:hyperosmotically inducible protein
MSFRIASLVFALSMLLTPGFEAEAQQEDFRTRRVEFELRHELLMLPRYDVFDWLYFEVLEKGTVRLGGQVRTATLKGDAERAAKRVEGVEQIVNEIEILPVSSSDDKLRVALYRALFWDTPLEQYSYQALNPIHIIVKNGRVTLEGVVRTEMDKTVAGFKAREVPFVFNVDNNLVAETK